MGSGCGSLWRREGRGDREEREVGSLGLGLGSRFRWAPGKDGPAWARLDAAGPKWPAGLPSLPLLNLFLTKTETIK